MKPCTNEDFGTDEASTKYYQSWNGFMLMCPAAVNKEGKKLTLNGAWGMNQTSRIQFRVDRCTDPDNLGKCESDTEIDKLLRDMQIQTWIVTEHINFNNMDKKPVSK